VVQGISLHIGLNSVDPAHYSGWSGPLVACEADARDMQAIAKSVGFRTSILLTAQATRDMVLYEIAAAAKILVAGDIFLITNSSHGGQVPDLNGDEADGLDETWCLYNGELIDDELYMAITAFVAGVRIVIASDSCHSGTVAKTPEMQALYGDMFKYTMAMSGLGSHIGIEPKLLANDFLAAPRPKAMPPEIALRTYMENKEFYDSKNSPEIKNAQANVAASGILLAGCQDNQLSMDGTFNGKFTETLKAVWNGGAYQSNYAQFVQDIRAKMPATQSPNYFPFGASDPAFAGQRPFSI
jgi:hypothetical protein